MDPNPSDVFAAARHAAIALQKAEQRLEEVLLTQDRHESGCLTVNTHGTPNDLSAVMVARIARRDDAVAALEDARQRYEDAKRLGELILYGRSGSGGIAARRPSDADIIAAYYVDGYQTWADVGAEIDVAEHAKYAGDWARLRAKRALLWADEKGVRALVAT